MNCGSSTLTRTPPSPSAWNCSAPRAGPNGFRGLPDWQGQLSVDGSLLCRLAPGTYQFHAEHGPEFRDIRGTFQLSGGATDTKTMSLERIVDMGKHGWYAGDLCVGRAAADLPMAARAEGIDFVSNLIDHASASRAASETRESPDAPALR